MALSYAQTVERIRKWSVKYNGGIDPIDFVESIEEVADLDDINVNLVPRMMPILLEDKALMWYRNNNKQYFKRLEDEVRTRLQKKQESFKDYLIEIKYLMRHTDMNQDSQLERIYRNMRTEYQMYIKRRDFSSLTELAILADDFEELRAEQDKVSRGGVRQEVIVGRIEIEYPQTMVLENTMRCVPTTPIQDKLIPSSNSESPILNQQKSNQQRNQPTAKQVTARIIQDQDIFQNQMYQVSTQQNIQHVMPLRENLKPFNRNQVTEVQQMNPEAFKPAQVTPDQETFQSQTKQVSVHQTLQRATPFKENLKSFNQNQVKVGKLPNEVQIQTCGPQQDSKPIQENPKIFRQQRVTSNHEMLPVEIQELQSQLKPRFIKENPEVSEQQRVNPIQQILQAQTQKVQRQKEPIVIKAQKYKIQRHRDPTPGKENSQVANQPRKISPTRNHHITQVEIQDIQGCVEQQQVQDIETQQGQRKVTVIEDHTRRVRLTQETPSPTQSLQQVSIKHDSQRKQESQEGKDDSTRPKDKIDNPLIQVQELSLGIPKPFSTQKLQKPMNNLDVLQQKDYDVVSIHQDKFFKIFKSPKKRHRNHAGR
ncbi:uncharacterized protein LOC119665706 [Teleopsis dalmanni]|uniref:uncharacterized protein LOC119665706 n=1 Tax=Teleopsis dalmanni TaxID=139649 RepID=UPI0018CF5E58|nr:uncharacterized protein LOC119665706 [Teleopsis dalmanni]